VRTSRNPLAFNEVRGATYPRGPWPCGPGEYQEREEVESRADRPEETAVQATDPRAF
jgi:hypothetical protein